MHDLEAACPSCGKYGVVGKDLRCTFCQAALEFDDVDGRLRFVAKGQPCPACGDRESPPDVIYCVRCRARTRFFCPLCRTRHRLVAQVCSRTGRILESRWKEDNWRPRWQQKFYTRPWPIAAGFVLLSLLMLLSRAPSLLGHPVAAGGGFIADRPQLEVAFVVDSTGSMGSEIEVVKQRLREMIARVRSGQPAPHVRYALVTYRDRGDDYVTKKWDFTDDAQAMTEAVDSLVADGGGDVPESVNEALHVALHDLSWDPSQKASRMLFLIGDAGPHMDYPNDYDYHTECKIAHQMGIPIHVIGCNGIEQGGLTEFREMASLSGGDFEFLTYRQAWQDPRGKTHYTLTAGDRRYDMDEDRADWKDGAEHAAERYHLKPAAPPMAGAMATPVDRSSNNLDSVITGKVLDSARAAGVSY